MRSVFLRSKYVCEHYGGVLSMWILRRTKDARFPQPTRLGVRVTLMHGRPRCRWDWKPTTDPHRDVNYFENVRSAALE